MSAHLTALNISRTLCLLSRAGVGGWGGQLPSEALRDEWVEAIKRAGYAAQGDSPQGTGGGGGGGPPPVPGNHPGMGKRMPSSGSMGGRALPPPPTDASPQVDTTPDVGPDGEPPFVAFPPDGSPFSDASWHFGRAPRKVCENLLKRHGSEGSFMLRTSESNPGNYSLSVMDSDAPRHYKVTPQPGGGYILTGCAETIFDDLGKLVEYYITASKGRSHPLDKNAIAKLEIAFSGPCKKELPAATFVCCMPFRGKPSSATSPGCYNTRAN